MCPHACVPSFVPRHQLLRPPRFAYLPEGSKDFSRNTCATTPWGTVDRRYVPPAKPSLVGLSRRSSQLVFSSANGRHVRAHSGGSASRGRDATPSRSWRATRSTRGCGRAMVVLPSSSEAGTGGSEGEKCDHERHMRPVASHARNSRRHIVSRR
jgi:hypothetical protein